MNSLCKIFVVMLLVAFSPMKSFGATLEELLALIETDKMEEAYLLAKTMRSEFMGQSDFDFLYGLVARQTGHAAEAVFAFERVMMLDPSDMRTLFEHAQALIDINDFQGAIKDLELILSTEGVDETIQTNSQQTLELLNQALTVQGSSFSISGGLKVDIGYNSNINSGTNGPPIFPVQGPQSDDGFVNYGANALGRWTISKTHAIYLTVASDNRKNFQSTTFDSNSISAQGGYQLSLENLTIRLPLSVDVNFTDYTYDRLNGGGGVEFGYQWNPENLTTFSADFSVKTFVANSDNNYFAAPFTFSHWVNNLLPGMALTTNIYYAPGWSWESPINQNPVVHSEVGLWISSSIQVAEGHVISPSVNLLYLYYPVNFYNNGERNDVNFTGGISYDWQISDSWAISSSFSYNYGWSSDPGQIYQRFQPQLSVRYSL